MSEALRPSLSLAFVEATTDWQPGDKASPVEQPQAAGILVIDVVDGKSRPRRPRRIPRAPLVSIPPTPHEHPT